MIKLFSLLPILLMLTSCGDGGSLKQPSSEIASHSKELDNLKLISKINSDLKAFSQDQEIIAIDSNNIFTSLSLDSFSFKSMDINDIKEIKIVYDEKSKIYDGLRPFNLTFVCKGNKCIRIIDGYNTTGISYWDRMSSDFSYGFFSEEKAEKVESNFKILFSNLKDK